MNFSKETVNRIALALNIAMAILALGSLVVAIIALVISVDVRDSNKKAMQFERIANISASYDPKSDYIFLAPTEENKIINAGAVIFPTDFGLPVQRFFAPNNRIKFGPIREAMRNLIPRLVDLKKGFKPAFKAINIPIPIGILSDNSFQGGSFQAGTQYYLYVKIDLGNAIRGDLKLLDIIFGNIIHDRPFDLPGFYIFKWPWEKLTQRQTDDIVFGERVKEVREIIDQCWKDITGEAWLSL